MSKYNLFLDDERMPSAAGKYMKNNIYYNLDWVIVRDYEQFVNYITIHGLPDIVSFDHDLAAIHYDPSTWVQGFVYKEKTGMDCVKWLVDYCINTGNEFPIWYLHTMNPVGRENMRSYITSFLKSKANV
jgi:hypothetical protein